MYVRHACRLKLVNATLDELSARSNDADEEMSRMERLGRQYQLDYIQAAARHRHSSLIRPSNTEQAAEPQDLAAAAAAVAAIAGAEVMAGAEEGLPVAAVSAAAAAAAAAVAAGGDELPVTGNAWGTCDVCRCVCLQSCALLCRNLLRHLCMQTAQGDICQGLEASSVH
jgi:hypothetical protein